MAETELQSLVDLNKQFEEARLNSRLQAELRTRHFEEQKLHSQYLEKQLLEMKEILISMAARNRGQISSSKNPAQNIPSTPVSQLHSTMNPPLTDPFRSGQLTANRNQQVASGESSRFELKDDPISTKEPSDRIAHQVLDKMPELFADKINLEIAHVSSIEELHGLEAFGNDVREQVVWALGNNAGDSPQCRDLARQGGELMPHLTQINEHTDLINLPSVLATEEIVTNYIDELCFDPGGEEILYAFDSLDWCRVDIKLSDVPAMTNDDCLLGKRVRNGEVLNQVEESAQVRIKEEPNIVKERSDLTAHQVLDEMPKSIVDELDFKITPGSLAEELDDMKDFEVSDLNHVTSFSLVENVAADLVRFLGKPPNQEEIVMGYIGLLCFDPGGNSAGVLLGRHIVDYDLSYYRHLNSIELINWHAKLNLERSDFGIKTLILTWSSLLIFVESFIFDAGGECHMRIEVVKIFICKAWAHSTLTAFTYVFAALIASVNSKSPRIGNLLLRRIVLQLIRAYKRNDKPQLVAAAKFIAHLVNQMVCHELIALELLEILLSQPTDESVEVVVGFVTECGAILQDLSLMGPSVRRLYVQGKEINGAGINSSFATMYAHWVASLTLAEFWITQIYGFVFDPGGEVAGVLCEKSSVDCDLSYYWCLSPAEWVPAAELVQVQVQAAATSTDDIICQVPLPQLIEDKIVYIYETLSTQVGDMGLCSKWAYVDPMYFVALIGILDLIITSSIFIFDPDEACSTAQD